MKKLSYFLTATCALLALASCSEDKDPVYHAPTPGSFSLYAPAMQDQYIVLTQDGTLQLTTSGQPDYGYSAVAIYTAQLSLTGDFDNEGSYFEISPIDVHQSNMSLKQYDVAQGVCELLGLDSEDAFNTAYPDGVMPYMQLYFRAKCNLNNVEGSEIVTNVVSYNHVQPYFAVAVPGYIYLVGNVTGWNEPSEGNAASYADWRLFEPANAIGSKIYSGKFDLSAAPMFRFYTALTGWDADSYGYQEADEATDFPEFTGESSWTSSLVKGKGAYNFPNFPGGEVTIVVDMSVDSNMTVTISAGDVEVFVPQYIYAMGTVTDPNWIEPVEANADQYAPYKMANSSAAEAVFTGKFPVAAGDTYIRFVYDFLGWDDGQWGYQEADESTLFEMTNNSFSSPYVKGKGSWQFSFSEAGTLEAAVDTDNQTVTFTFEPGE